MKPHYIAIFLVTLNACSQAQENTPKVLSSTTQDTAIKRTISMSDYSPSPAKAHPKAKQIMNEDFYWSPIEETAPFGSDDGADTYAGFAEWRQTHKTSNPKEFLTEQIASWGYPAFDLQETNLENLRSYLKADQLGSRYMSGIDAAIVSIAFGQLYLEGTINKDFKELAKTSIKRQLIPELLSLWGEEYKAVREAQLKKMLAALDQAD